MSVCLATMSSKLTNTATAVGYYVVLFIAFTTQTFIFATKTNGKVVSLEYCPGKFDMADVCRRRNVIHYA